MEMYLILFWMWNVIVHGWPLTNTSVNVQGNEPWCDHYVLCSLLCSCANTWACNCSCKIATSPSHSGLHWDASDQSQPTCHINSWGGGGGKISQEAYHVKKHLLSTRTDMRMMHFIFSAQRWLGQREQVGTEIRLVMPATPQALVWTHSLQQGLFPDLYKSAVSVAAASCILIAIIWLIWGTDLCVRSDNGRIR